MAQKNFRVILKSRPGRKAVPSEANFEYQKCPFPEAPAEGQVLIKNLYLSVDPTLRFSMNEGEIPYYQKRWEINQTIVGVAGIGIVQKANSKIFQVGDFVINYMSWPWQMYFLMADTQLEKVNPALAENRLRSILSCVGVTGLTSLLGITEKGHLISGTNQTFVVSGGAGACGSLAGQIARLEGCGKLIGICGSDEKCRFLEEIGFEVAINYKADDVSEKLKLACPNGVDRYFDNVGGEISNAVIRQMNHGSHIILCGQISQYDNGIEYPFPPPVETKSIIEERNITRERYLVLDYEDKYTDSIQKLSEWFKDGKLKVRESVEEGLENAAKGFLKMMRGENIGKQLVHVADP